MSKGWSLLEPGSLMPSFESLRDGSWKCTCDLSVLTNSHHQSYTYHLYHPVSSLSFHHTPARLAIASGLYATNAHDSSCRYHGPPGSLFHGACAFLLIQAFLSHCHIFLHPGVHTLSVCLSPSLSILKELFSVLVTM